MRLAIRLLVLVATALAVVAIGSPSASAQGEVSAETTSDHCSAVTLSAGHTVAGGCRIRVVSESELILQAFVGGFGWLTISTCEAQVEAALGEDGAGYVYDAVLTPHQGPPCTRRPCDETTGAQLPWPLLVTAGSLEITYCLRTVFDPPGAAGTWCHMEVPLATDGHQVELTTTGASGSGACENLGGSVRIIGHGNVVPDVSHPAVEGL